MSKKIARTLKLFAALALVALIALAAYFHFTHGPTEFDREVWLAGEKQEFSPDAPRLRMADGLIASRSLVGKTKEQVESLLGPQTDTNYFRPEYDLVYWLGAERSYISIDSEWLALKIGKGNVVSEARIVRD